jgi:hypothetical protein
MPVGWWKLHAPWTEVAIAAIAVMLSGLGVVGS